MKEVNLKKVYTDRFQLYNILEKAKVWRQLKKKTVLAERRGRDE